MNKPVPYTHNPFEGVLGKIIEQFKPRSGSFWIRIGLISLGLYIILHKDISIVLEFNNFSTNPDANIGANASQLGEQEPKAVKAVHKEGKSYKKSRKKEQNIENPANTFSNMPFEEKDDDAKNKLEKRRKMKLYVKQYATYAQSEMKKHGIPASITLAQGLLESDAGESRLAVDNNNHFGIKCFSKTCKRGHCSNYTDDSHKDFFRKFKNPGESFKAHSELLQKERYQFLYNYKRTDYVSWARGLKNAGYATDPDYDSKLINLIRELDLHDYDR